MDVIVATPPSGCGAFRFFLLLDLFQRIYMYMRRVGMQKCSISEDKDQSLYIHSVPLCII
jgi:hypothetical protein